MDYKHTHIASRLWVRAHSDLYSRLSISTNSTTNCSHFQPLITLHCQCSDHEVTNSLLQDGTLTPKWKMTLSTNTAQHIHMEPLLTSPNQKRWKQNWTATFQPPGCLWFLSWMKELPHSFPEGSEVSLCTACLPARHGSRMLSDWY